MDFLEFKEKIHDEYSKFNSNIEVPDDEELLKIFLSAIVLSNYQIKQIKKSNKLERGL